ncbi:SWI/SNF and RSC complex subunit Ssr2 [Capsaspora owczarzaki ATCC 30864]|uniref:SWI/SNF and RSC complex subunit Ssr2 n=1 Tax=Capsaspora owczarzaki (strain ATCC 30864) TaxID=595528 RepID=A0A0D2WSG8_CAPO3|nr:SWI/SNF and RSC complex subunit Ssr2 [Capsaspora owczarzaki ATCC 30864]KJE95090.1 SWI/SNF and RSC complex subunit Ssr2 [Capsaspora owczarzaki ATCC 30864]|eukprot:XP_004346255.2 SWI/SNF and RSC complex subunit Ssr2 [Capsaspora owczarzaki ATCC 30864]
MDAAGLPQQSNSNNNKRRRSEDEDEEQSDKKAEAAAAAATTNTTTNTNTTTMASSGGGDAGDAGDTTTATTGAAGAGVGAGAAATSATGGAADGSAPSAAAGGSKAASNSTTAPATTAAGHQVGSNSTVTRLIQAPAYSSFPSTQVLAEQTHPLLVPSFAAWFDYNALHTIERRALPEFFNGRNRSKTPEIYIAYRNFMVDCYRLNPLEYLTATACRRNLAGDVCAILRVHAFLEHWGIINYQVDPEVRPSPVGPPSTSHFGIVYDTPAGWHAGPSFTSLVQAANHSSASGTANSTSAVSETASSGPSVASVAADSVASNAATSAPATPRGGSLPSLPRGDTYHGANIKCASCTSACASGFYQSQTQDVRVCGTCYLQGHLPASLKPADFSRVETADLTEWSDEETLLLLEGIEMFKEDWNKVSEHVGTRTHEECVLRFLRLPIEEPFLESAAGSSLGPLAHQPTPFSSAANPVMATITFLAGSVEPAVAAAAARAAIVAAGGAPSENLSNGDHKPVAMDVSDETSRKASNVSTAAATAIASAAVRAKVIALAEEKKAYAVLGHLLDTQLRKLDLKLKNFEELEAIVEKERQQLETQRQALLVERLQFQAEKLRFAESSRAAAVSST